MKRAVACALIGLLALAVRSRAGDLPLNPNISWTLEAVGLFSNFGRSVAAAGDFNRDGYGDLIIGGPAYDNPHYGGRMHIYLGSATGLGPREDWIFEESQVGARYGEVVSWAGDLNDDGYDDVAVAAPLWQLNYVREGKVEVHYGRPTRAARSPSTVRGRSTEAHFGSGLCGGGDVDGDGHDDLLIGAPGHDGAGALHLFAGGGGLADTAAWSYVAQHEGAEVGACVAGMGDINGDGYNDAVAGAPGYAVEGVVLGAVYVFLGEAAGLGSAPSAILVGTAPDGGYGRTVAMADVDGNGYSDVVVGAPDHVDPGSAERGRVFVYRSCGRGGELSPPIVLAHGNHYFGYSVASSGDLNGDGYDEVMAGSHHGYTNESKEVAFVYLGVPGGELHNIDQTIYFKTRAGDYETFTANVGGAGDLNGDHVPDIAIGHHNDATGYRGMALSYSGNPQRGRLGREPAFTLSHIGAGARALNAGDVDGDGWDDLLVTSYLHDADQEDAGAAFLFAGGPEGWSDEAVWATFGSHAGQWLGHGAAALGDVDGDGFADVALGAPHANGRVLDEGAVYCFLGSSAGLPVKADFVSRGGQRGSALGHSLAGGGDVNGDGYSDFVVGAPLHDGASEDEGRVVVYYGNPHSLSDSLRAVLTGAATRSWFGYAVAIPGDTDRDGYSDVVVGAPYFSDGEADEGAVFVFEGGPGGLASTPTRVIELDRAGAKLGTSLAGAGDATGNNYPDIIVAAGGNPVGLVGLGSVFIFEGSAQGLTGEARWSSTGPIVGSAYGHSVMGLGDVNGDGYGDVAVGDPLFDGAHVDCGRVSIYKGRPGGPEQKPAWVLDGAGRGANLGQHLNVVGDANFDGWSDLLATGSGSGGPAVALYETQSAGRLLIHARQVPPDYVGTIALRGYSGQANRLHLSVRFRPPTGATRVGVEYQVIRRSQPWEEATLRKTGLRVLTPENKRAGNVMEIRVPAAVATGDRHLKWRVRLVTNDPRSRTSRWFYHANNPAFDASVLNGVAPDVPPPPDPPPVTETRSAFSVGAPFPNPFNPNVTIPFTLDRRARVRVTIHDVRGALVSRLVDDKLPAGPHQARWDGTGTNGAGVASGIYFVRVERVGRVVARKLILVR